MSTPAATRFGDLTDAAAARWGNREALVFRDRRYSFAQMAAQVDRVARGLIRAGVRPGDKAAIRVTSPGPTCSPARSCSGDSDPD